MTDRKGEVKWLKQPSSKEWEDYQKAVGPKYSQVSESIRRVAPGGLTCSMFCGGKNCKYDNPAKINKNEMAIKGLYSSWVTADILATSRPSSYAVKEYDVISQFKKHEIRSIINLQHPGEHASCGFGLEPSGFSYNPQEFMDEDVFYYNYGWNDYGVRSLVSILDIVKVMDFAVSGGKVAVHCHAGLGRTGVVIACYLIFRDRMEADEAIHHVRKHRPKAIQTRGQIGCVQDFAKYLQPMRNVFSISSGNEHVTKGLTLDEFLIKQKHLLHGEEEKKLRYVPKIVYVLCQRILDLANISFDLGKVTCLTRKLLNLYNKSSLLDPDNNSTSFDESSVYGEKDTLNANENISTTQKETESRESPFAVVDKVKLHRNRSVSLCQDVDQLGIANLTIEKSRSDMDLSGMQAGPNLGSQFDTGSVTLSEAASVDISHDDGQTYANTDSNYDDNLSVVSRVSDCSGSVHASLEPNSTGTAQRGGMLEPLKHRKKEKRKRRKSKNKQTTEAESDAIEEGYEVESEHIPSRCVGLSTPSDAIAEDIQPGSPYCLGLQDLCQCLSTRSVDQKVLLKVDRYKRKLNTSNSAWTQLEMESDIRVIGTLLWGWLEHLQEPILKATHLRDLSSNMDDVEQSLKVLDRNTRKTFQCLLVTISKLSPIPSHVHQRLCRRLSVSLTKDKTLKSKPRSNTNDSQSSEGGKEGTDFNLPYAGNGHICMDFVLEWISKTQSKEQQQT